MEHDPTDEERSEAEALARALDRGSGSAGLPEDALETAALLRYSADGGELGAERSRAVFEEVLATAKMPAPSATRARWRWLAWLVPAVGVAAATAAALFVVAPAMEPAAPVATQTTLPSPSAELLAAQAATARGRADAPARLRAEMRTHRQRLLAALSERYGRRAASPAMAPATVLLAAGPSVLVLGTTGCAAETRPSEPSRWLAEIENAHAEAEAALEGTDRERARETLAAALALVVPAEVEGSDRRILHQDLRWALAEIELDAGDAAAALRHADAGLELGREQDLYTANLLVARGRALAATAREIEAADDYYRALEINDALLRRTLDIEEGG